jgi:hypothetical protein
MALYRLVCAPGHQSLVTMLTRCGLPLPTYFLADEKHSHCQTIHRLGMQVDATVRLMYVGVESPWTSSSSPRAVYVASIPHGEADDVVAGLFHERAAPTLPPDRLVPEVGVLARQAVRHRQGAQQPRQHEGHAHGPRGVLRWMFHTPRRLTRLDPARLDQTAVIRGLAGLQGLLPRGMSQEDRVAPWAIIPPMPRAADHGVDGVGLKGPAMVGSLGSAVPSGSEVVSPVIPPTAVSSRSVPAVLPWP